MTEKKLPDLTDPLTQPFWEGTANGIIRVQRCDNCGYLRWPPATLCQNCQTIGGTWVEVSPQGTLYSYVTYHRAFDTAFEDDIPYTVALVALDDGPRMYGRLLGEVETSSVGKPVRAVFEKVAPEVTYVWWELAG